MPKHCLAPVLRHDHYLILTFLHSPFTLAKLCHSLMTIPPCPWGLTSGGIVSFYRRNGIAFSSLTGRAGGLPNCLIKQPAAGAGHDLSPRSSGTGMYAMAAGLRVTE